MQFQLEFEGIRCFRSPQKATLAPLTVLVGENSSGKTTFLALMRIAWDAMQGNVRGDIFNEPPFLLGAYDQIASDRGGRLGRENQFRIKWTIPVDSGFCCIESTWSCEQGQPALQRWHVSLDDTSIIIPSNPDSPVVVQTRKGKEEIANHAARFIRSVGVLEWMTTLDFGDLSGLHAHVSTRTLKELEQVAAQTSRLGRPYAVAPVRTSPRRTYDPISDEPNPEGTHVPMLLARLASSRTTEWHSIQSALSGFGKGSGLFDSIQVVRKGKKQSDPFQLNVKIKGPSFNLVDVGYGVSQVLPILVDSLQERRETTQLLLQQPEVHLHPKAQAELGSFFAHTTKKHGVRFVIETHSDHLIDRIRMAIRDGKLKPQDVSLLFFERRESEAAIHTLKLDEQGQILDAPASYRRFFLTEERRILGLD